jgi:hypothetical protein
MMVQSNIAAAPEAEAAQFFTTQQGSFTVVVPSNAGQANIRYFQQLRSGSNVLVEGSLTGTSRIDLQRFI